VASCPSGEYPGEFVDLDRSSPTLDSVGSLTALLLSGSPSYRRVIVGDSPSPIIDVSGSHVEGSRRESRAEKIRDARAGRARAKSRAAETARCHGGTAIRNLRVLDKRAGATAFRGFGLLHNWAFR